ncbi:MAG: type II toxin-antitoxin system PemK/MazF family toxin [Actinobacteria bacterium]|nr:type II toxin-antitoxin system PemK/MazF family toxin [Actinomycetota bacterium]
MRRGEIYWADLPHPLGRRPVVVLTRDAAIPVLRWITVAPITGTVRGIPTEVPVGRAEGLARDSVISTDNVQTIRKSRLEHDSVGALRLRKIRELDAALRFALDIRY